jgi:hypothetical protein
MSLADFVASSANGQDSGLATDGPEAKRTRVCRVASRVDKVQEALDVSRGELSRYRKEDFEKFTVLGLKSILRKNGCTVGGTKPCLLNRCCTLLSRVSNVCDPILSEAASRDD